MPCIRTILLSFGHFAYSFGDLEAQLSLETTVMVSPHWSQQSHDFRNVNIVCFTFHRQCQPAMAWQNPSLRVSGSTVLYGIGSFEGRKLNNRNESLALHP